jgi:hypothetical protein
LPVMSSLPCTRQMYAGTDAPAIAIVMSPILSQICLTFHRCWNVGLLNINRLPTAGTKAIMVIRWRASFQIPCFAASRLPAAYAILRPDADVGRWRATREGCKMRLPLRDPICHCPALICIEPCNLCECAGVVVRVTVTAWVMSCRCACYWQNGNRCGCRYRLFVRHSFPLRLVRVACGCRSRTVADVDSTSRE